MMVDEKNIERILTDEACLETEVIKKSRNHWRTAASMLFFCLCGALLGGERIIPVCAALAGAVSPLNGLCIFAGSTAANIAGGTPERFIADIIAMLLITGTRLITFRITEEYPSCRISAIMSAVMYLVGGAAAAFASRITPALIAAVFFRALICGAVTYFAAFCSEEYRLNGRINVTGSKALGTAVLFVLMVSALSGLGIGSFTPVRAAVIFIILAAGGRFGSCEAAAVGGAAALGFILGEAGGTDLSEMVRSSAIITCAGIAAGRFSAKGRTVSAAVYAASVLMLTLFMGRIQWAAALMTDTAAAAVLYCLIPDGIYMKCINGVIKQSHSSLKHMCDGMLFASEAVAEVRSNVSKAADALGTERNTDNDYLAEEVCGRICSDCRSSELCCKGSAKRKKYVFSAAVRILRAKGYITERELPKSLEGCTRRTELAECFNDEYMRIGAEKRLAEASGRMWECVCEQLCAEENMLCELGEACDDKSFDEVLSERVSGVLSFFGGKESSAAVYYDSCGRLFISCFCRGQLDTPMENLTARLIAMTDRELEPPDIFRNDKLIRLRWHEPPVYALDTGKAVMNGREEVSGDSSASFSDGLGSEYFIISDGMGSGKRAALESSITVSILKKLIRSGMGISAAVRMANLMLLSKSGEEIFSTVDILCINVFTGRADMVKLGAPQSLFKTGGSVKAIESRTLPVGIISPAEFEKRTIHLSDGDCAVMFSDGIIEEDLPAVRELMLSEGYSPQRCADAIVDRKNGELPPADDKTVFVVRLHKI